MKRDLTTTYHEMFNVSTIQTQLVSVKNANISKYVPPNPSRY